MPVLARSDRRRRRSPERRICERQGASDRDSFDCARRDDEVLARRRVRGGLSRRRSRRRGASARPRATRSSRRSSARDGLRVAILSGGETRVVLGDGEGGGRGGRNTEYFASLALELDGCPGVFALAADTDGIDGHGDHAGAFVVPETLRHGAVLGTSLAALLARHDTYSYFDSGRSAGEDRPHANQRKRFQIDPVPSINRREPCVPDYAERARRRRAPPHQDRRDARPRDRRPRRLEELILAGADVFRINFSHGTAADQAKRVETVRRVSEKVGRHIGIMGDLARPEDPHRVVQDAAP